MFVQTRFQTGELDDVIKEMKNGTIPVMDVDDNDELNWVIDQLAKRGMYKVEDLPYDKDARDKLKEPEFEYRIAFYTSSVKSSDIDKKELMYIDFYTPLIVDEDYDSILGD